MWRSAQMDHGELDEGSEHAADLIDMLWRLAQLSATGSTEGAPRVVRPQDLRARDRAAERSRRAKRRLEETEWEEV